MEKGTGYFSCDLRGRPRGRRVEARPSLAAILVCQVDEPNGCWRLTQVRSVVRSGCESGWSTENGSSCGSGMNRGNRCRLDFR